MNKIEDNKYFFLITAGLLGVGAYMFSSTFSKNLEDEPQNDKDQQKIEKLQKILKTLQNSNKLEEEDEYKMVQNPQQLQSNKKQVKTSQKQVHKVVLTGGPCNGSTTCLIYYNSFSYLKGLVHVQEKLMNRGFQCFTVPSITQVISTGGINIKDISQKPEYVLIYQHLMMNLQAHLEQCFSSIASLEKQSSVILCNQGLMDAKVGMVEETWQMLLDEIGWNIVTMRDRRYDLVIHLVSSALGAEDFYNLPENNVKFHPSLKFAKSFDKNTMNAWIGHQNLHIIDNQQTSFDQKKNKCLEIVLKYLGMPGAVAFYKKYLIQNDPQEFELIEDFNFIKLHLEITFLMQSNGLRRKLIKRGQQGQFTYILVTKRDIDGQEQTQSQNINSRQYLTLFQEKDNERKILVIERSCFTYQEKQNSCSFNFISQVNIQWINL